MGSPEEKNTLHCQTPNLFTKQTFLPILYLFFPSDAHEGKQNPGLKSLEQSQNKV